MSTKRKYTDEDFRKAVESSISIAEVLRKIGYGRAGGDNYRHFHNVAEKLGVDTDHFLGQGHLKGKTHNWIKCRPVKAYLKKNIICCSSHLRKRLIHEGLLENQCDYCKLKPIWNDMDLIMHLDHINGDSTDNRIKNLRLLCPNCHSQTSTYCGKNKGK